MGQTLIGHRRTPKAQRIKTDKPTEVVHPGVAYGCIIEVQDEQALEPAEMLQPGIGNGCAIKEEFL
jgi:hypothetical protein